ncbi:MAG: rod shape-determining protein MreD [Clostridia bacterium]|nr:rod shape-determining protein MreD [Clostridia bacterium]
MRYQSESRQAVWQIVFTVIFILLITALQTTIIRGFEVFHVVPNLLFITVVCYSLQRGNYGALFFGFICGLILDLLGGRAIGINGLLCTFAAYFCVYISDSLFNNNMFVSMFFVGLLTLVYELLTYIFYFAIWGHGAFGYALLCKVLPAAIYNFVFTMVLYPVIRRLAS